MSGSGSTLTSTGQGPPGEHRLKVCLLTDLFSPGVIFCSVVYNILVLYNSLCMYLHIIYAGIYCDIANKVRSAGENREGVGTLMINPHGVNLTSDSALQLLRRDLMKVCVNILKFVSTLYISTHIPFHC